MPRFACCRSKSRLKYVIGGEPLGLKMEPLGLKMEPLGLKMEPLGLKMEPLGLKMAEPVATTAAAGGTCRTCQLWRLGEATPLREALRCSTNEA